jgi:hypothetical protein
MESSVAVLLVGPEEKTVNFPLSLLPPIHEGSVLQLVIERDEYEEEKRHGQAERLLQQVMDQKLK